MCLGGKRGKTMNEMGCAGHRLKSVQQIVLKLSVIPANPLNIGLLRGLRAKPGLETSSTPATAVSVTIPSTVLGGMGSLGIVRSRIGEARPTYLIWNCPVNDLHRSR